MRVLSTRDGATWTPLPSPGPTAWEQDTLAMDSRGRLHLSWTSRADAYEARQVHYARFEAGAWTVPEQLSHSPGHAGFPSLVVDAADRPHVAWYGFDGTCYQIHYRRLDPGGWTSERALPFPCTASCAVAWCGTRTISP